MLAAGALVTARASLGNRPLPAVPWVALAAFIVTYVGVILWVMPALEDRKVVPEVARWTAQHASPETRIATYRLNRWSNAFRFYVDRHAPHLDAPGKPRRSSRSLILSTALMSDRPMNSYWPRASRSRSRTNGTACGSRRAGAVAQALPPTRFVVVTRKTDPQ